MSVADQFPSDVPDEPELVSCEREGSLVWLTLQRPEVMNCLSFSTLRRFRTLCEELREAGYLYVTLDLMGYKTGSLNAGLRRDGRRS